MRLTSSFSQQQLLRHVALHVVTTLQPRALHGLGTAHRTVHVSIQSTIFYFFLLAVSLFKLTCAPMHLCIYLATVKKGYLKRTNRAGTYAAANAVSGIVLSRPQPPV